MQGFSSDVMQERILNKIFFNVIFEQYICKKYRYNAKLIEFNSNINLQYQGVDLVINAPNDKKTCVDIKSQTNKYINNPTQTFSLELAFVKDNEFKLGWFAKKEMKTDYYLFVWIQEAKTIKENNVIFIKDKNDLKHFDCMFVKRQDIYDYLLKNGITNSVCSNIIRKFYNDDGFGKWNNNKTIKSYRYNKSIKFTYSNWLQEKPINIILNKNVYANLPHTMHLVYDNGVIREQKHLNSSN